MLPALRAEFVGVGPEVVGAPVHGVDHVVDHFAFADEDGGGAGGAASEGKDGVGDGFAAVKGDDGGEAEGWVGLGKGLGVGGGGCIHSFMTALRYFKFLSCSKVGRCPRRVSLTSCRSLAQTSGRLARVNHMLPRRVAVVSRPARSTFKISSRTRTGSSMVLTTSCMKT